MMLFMSDHLLASLARSTSALFFNFYVHFLQNYYLNIVFFQTSLCQVILKERDAFLSSIGSEKDNRLYQISNLLLLCCR